MEENPYKHIKLTEEELKAKIATVYEKVYAKDGHQLTYITGRGGVKDCLRSWIEDEMKLPYTWKNMRKAYRFLYNLGSIKKISAHLYQIS